jgi:hypothetical protein
MIDDGYLKDLTNKFFETQLRYNDTIGQLRFPNVVAGLSTFGHLVPFWPVCPFLAVLAIFRHNSIKINLLEFSKIGFKRPSSL